MATNSLQSASSRDDYSQESQERIKFRQNILGQIIEEGKIRGDIIDENYLLFEMRDKGIQNYTRSKLYQDRLVFDSQNTYIRDFLPRYSQVQADIFFRLEQMERECIELASEPYVVEKTIFRDTKDGKFKTTITEDHTKKFKLECIKACTKVLELKQKHCEGQNIQIASVIIQKELQTKKAQLIKLTTENEKLTVIATKDQK